MLAHEEHGGSNTKATTVREKQFKHSVFALILLGLLVIALLATLYLEALAKNLGIVAFAAIILFLVWRFDFILQLKEYERAVIMRLGKVNRVGGPGWTIVLSPLESYKVVDLRTRTVDIPPQDVITKDRIAVKIDTVIYLKVNSDNQSVINSIVQIDDYIRASELFVIGLIRDECGSLTLDELISNAEPINKSLKEELGKLSMKWGVSVEEATITEVKPPEDVQAAREEQQIAAQKKLARLESAEAHKAEIGAVRDAAEKLSDKALAYYYVKALGRLGEGQSTKIIFPMELTELAKAISGKREAPQQDIEALLRQYLPIVKGLAKGKMQAKKRSASKLTKKSGGSKKRKQ